MTYVAPCHARIAIKARVGHDGLDGEPEVYVGKVTLPDWDAYDVLLLRRLVRLFKSDPIEGGLVRVAQAMARELSLGAVLKSIHKDDAFAVAPGWGYYNVVKTYIFWMTDDACEAVKSGRNRSRVKIGFGGGDEKFFILRYCARWGYGSPRYPSVCEEYGYLLVDIDRREIAAIADIDLDVEWHEDSCCGSAGGWGTGVVRYTVISDFVGVRRNEVPVECSMTDYMYECWLTKH